VAGQIKKEGVAYMDSTIIAALIGGGFAILAAFLTVYFSRVRKDTSVLPKFEPTEGLSVVIGIVQRDKEILMVRRRTREGNLSWQFPAGIVKPSIDIRDRAESEVKKETGVTCKFEKFIGSRVHCDTNILCQYVHCTYISGEATNLDLHENEEVRWVLAKEVKSYVTSHLYAEVARLLQRIESGENA
jgi:ADP-ribose pyrophosphatase YjhB (NUDIX family)